MRDVEGYESSWLGCSCFAHEAECCDGIRPCAMGFRRTTRYHALHKFMHDHPGLYSLPWWIQCECCIYRYAKSPCADREMAEVALTWYAEMKSIARDWIQMMAPLRDHLWVATEDSKFDE